jgi:ATP-dependent RNA helicase RhlE
MLAPTRELAIQVHESVKTYSRHVPIRSCCVYGGVDIKPQIAEIRCGVEVLVATPGRLLDLVEQKCLNFASVQALVLDEADRMLDMGFIPDVTRIINLLPGSGRACSSRRRSRKRSRSWPTACSSRRC